MLKSKVEYLFSFGGVCWISLKLSVCVVGSIKISYFYVKREFDKKTNK
ncbi:hypothetical protein SAMN05660206_102230 [Sphingobacterium wenxiniae]|uniref:Uncharacterized protein n=1 Tax=Sphingobacterium wenxiniae TaxID=683125 RepID=A0A1I6QAK3_9SPHI|nr:hypothetical protein SAMN05660206_102230 [Sphingobacterium wenxiniae]